MNRTAHRIYHGSGLTRYDKHGPVEPLDEPAIHPLRFVGMMAVSSLFWLALWALWSVTPN